MLTAIRIGNFKAFSETQNVPIRPITLLFGPNSSGKSSLIHSLILAHHAMETGELDVHRTAIGGESVDLGGFKQYVYHRDTSRQVEWGFELDISKLNKKMQETFHSAERVRIGTTIRLDYADDVSLNDEWLETGIDDFINAVESSIKNEEAVSENLVSIANGLKIYRYRSLKMKDIFVKSPQVNTYTVDVDNLPLLKMSLRKGGLLRLEYVNNAHPIILTITRAILETSTTATEIAADDLKVMDTAITETVPQIVASDRPRLIPRGIKAITSQPLLSDVLVPVSKGTRKEDLLSACKFFFPRVINEIIAGLADSLEIQLKKLRYLGPLRSYPPRHLAFAQYHDPNWYAGGGYAWDEVSKKADLRERINQWLGNPDKLSTPYELTVQHLLTMDDFGNAFTRRISDIEDEYIADKEGVTNEDGSTTYYDMDLFGELYNIPKDLKVIEQSLSEVRELVLKDKRTDTVVSHRDVGIGVSQVLPVLVSAFANKDSLVAIEQPEIHLHPALQAELGDVFIESALGENKNTFIIETHSEHLILRLLRRIRETTNGELEEGIFPLKPENIAVIYAQPTTEGTKLIELRVTDDGDFADQWPDGFFAERAKELF